MQKKSYRRSSKVALSANHVVGSLLETLENRALLSAAPQLLAADAEPAVQYQALQVKAATATPLVNVTPITNYAKEEGRVAYFQFTRTGSTGSALTLKLSIAGTARNGKDYQTLPSTVTFEAGQDKAYLAVKPIQDTVVERVERVGVTITPSTGYKVGTSAYAELRIIDDDAPLVSVSVPQNTTLAEDSSSPANVIFSRSGDLKNPVTINDYFRGKAVNGVDYVNIPQTFTIRAGKAKASLKLRSVDDLNPENDEYIDIRLGGGYYNVYTKFSRALVKVQDNDTAQLGLDFVTFRGPSINGKSYILRAPVSGGTPANLSNALTNLGKAGNDYAVNVSPDGQWMLFNTTRFGGVAGGSLAIIPVNNLAAGQQILVGGTTKITPVNGDVAIANGGNLVIYASADGPHEVDLWAAKRVEGVWSTSLLTNDSAYQYNVQPAISADGTKLLFAAGNSSDAQSTEAILEVNVDGTGLTSVLSRASNAGAANATAYLEHPNYDYASDGTAIPGGVVFGSNWDNQDQIWRKPTGAGVPTAVSAAINEFCPAVLPNGRIVTLWEDRLTTDAADVLELTVRYADGTLSTSLLGGVSIPPQSIGASA